MIWQLAVTQFGQIIPCQIAPRSSKFCFELGVFEDECWDYYEGHLTAVALSLTCRQIKVSVTDSNMFYKLNHFKFYGLNHMIGYMFAITPDRMRSITRVSCAFDFMYGSGESRFKRNVGFLGYNVLQFLDRLQHLEIIPRDKFGKRWDRQLQGVEPRYAGLLALRGLKSLKVTSDPEDLLEPRTSQERNQDLRELQMLLNESNVCMMPRGRRYVNRSFYQKIILRGVELDVMGINRGKLDTRHDLVSHRTRSRDVQAKLGSLVSTEGIN